MNKTGMHRDLAAKRLTCCRQTRFFVGQPVILEGKKSRPQKAAKALPVPRPRFYQQDLQLLNKADCGKKVMPTKQTKQSEGNCLSLKSL